MMSNCVCSLQTDKELLVNYETFDKNFSMDVITVEHHRLTLASLTGKPR